MVRSSEYKTYEQCKRLKSEEAMSELMADDLEYIKVQRTPPSRMLILHATQIEHLQKQISFLQAQLETVTLLAQSSMGRN
jgi:hypothetical protein